MHASAAGGARGGDRRRLTHMWWMTVLILPPLERQASFSAPMQPFCGRCVVDGARAGDGIFKPSTTTQAVQMTEQTNARCSDHRHHRN
jgi:hypothetical protein